MRKFIKSTREKAQGLRSPLRRSRSTSPNPTETSTGGTEAPRPSSTTPTSAGDDSSNLGSTSTIIASPPDRSSAPQIVVLQPLPTDHTLNSLALPSGNQNSSNPNPNSTTPGVGNPEISITPPSLWDRAFGNLSEEDRDEIHSQSVDRLDCLNKLLEKTIQSEDACREKGMKFEFAGKTFIVRDLAQKSISWISRFKEIGDIAVQYDPGHAALPWAGLRFLLEVALVENQNMGAVLVGVERTTRLLLRCKAYEKYYLEPTPKPFNLVSLEETLAQLYVAVLEFLACAKRFLNQSHIGRITSGLLDPDGIKSRFDTLDENERRLKQEMEVADRENRSRNHKEVMARSRELEKWLKELEEPIYRMDKNVRGIYQMLEDKRRGEILAWLSSMLYEKHHKHAMEGLLEDTGKWLLDKPEFREWQFSSTSGALWLHGIPGAGKTKLTSMVIDSLVSPRNQAREDEAVAYFYCNRNEPDRQDPTKIMQAFVKQLSLQSPECGLPKPVVAEYDKRSQGGHAAGRLEFQECQELMVTLLNSFRRTTVLIDALDESDLRKRGNFLHALKKIIDNSTSLVKIFISSRDDGDIVLRLNEVPNLFIEAKDNRQDIERFVKRELTRCIEDQILLSGNVSSDLKAEVSTVLINKANGMFQWVHLQIMYLCEMDFEHHVRKALGKLPETLGDAYLQTYDRIKKGRSPNEARNALMWVLCAEKPLSPDEWTHGVSWALKARANSDDPTLVLDALLSVCHNLVVLDRQQNYMTFAHLSVREFFETHPEFAGQAHIMATESCLALFTHGRPLDLGTPFHNYGIQYWAAHAKNCQDRISHLLVDFLGSYSLPSQQYEDWLVAADELSEELEYDRRYNYDYQYIWYFRQTVLSLSSTPPEPLLAAAWFGLHHADLWKPGAFNPNYTNESGQSLLFLTSTQGHKEVVQLLLNNGANTNDTAHHRLLNNLLVSVIQKDNAEILALLLAEGADFKHAEYKTITAAAAALGGGGVMALLFQRDPHINIPHELVLVAAMNRDAGVMELLLDRKPDIEITEEVIAEAARNSKDVMKLLLARDDIHITENVLIAAAESYDGKEQMTLLFDRKPDIEVTGVVVFEVAQSWDGKEIMELLLDRKTDIKITEEVAMAAAWNTRRNGKAELMGLLLDRKLDMVITEAVVMVAAENTNDENDVMALLLDRKLDIEATEALILSAAKCSKRSLELLFARDSNIKITEAMVAAAAGNQHNGEEILTLLLDKGSSIDITEEVVIAAINNGRVMRLLLDMKPDVKISEAVVVTAAYNQTTEIIELLLATDPNIKITEDVVVAAASNSKKDMMELLLARDANISISERVVVTAVGNCYSECKGIMKLLLDRKPDVEISEAVIVAAAGNCNNGPYLIKQLLNREPGIDITAAVVVAAAGNTNNEIMGLLLARDANIEITEEAIVAAIKNDVVDVLQLLLDRKPNIEITEVAVVAAAENLTTGVMKLLLVIDANIQITEAVVVAVAENYNVNMIELLLDRKPDIEISEVVLVAAAGSWDDEIMKLLLARNHDIKITEAMVVAAAEKSTNVMQLLLDRKPDIEITEAIVVTAAGYHSVDMIKLLLDRKPDIEIIEAVVVAAAGKSRKVMQLLLDRKPDIEITEAVVSAAAGNLRNGKEIMQLLLDRKPDIEITEAVVSAAARNSGNRKGIMQLLLDRKPDIEITEAVVSAAARNSRNGKEIMQLLMDRKPDIEITEAVVSAAARNLRNGKEIMQLLLDRKPDIEITEAAIAAAAGNYSKKVLQLLLDKKPDIEITEAVLVEAARNNSQYCHMPNMAKQILELLLDRDPNIEITEAVVTAAAAKSTEEVMELLLKRNPSIKITETILAEAAGNRSYTEYWDPGYIKHWNPLNIAKQIVQLLLDRDPSIEITEAVVTAAAKNKKHGRGVIRLLAKRAGLEVKDKTAGAIVDFFTLEHT